MAATIADRDQLRERRGLVYYAACSADLSDVSGQFVIEASTTPEQLDECVVALHGLLRAYAEAIAPVDLEQARNQFAVRSLGAQEQPYRRLEDAAQDLFVHGRVRSRAEWLAGVQAVSGEQVRQVFERMLARRPAPGGGDGGQRARGSDAAGGAGSRVNGVALSGCAQPPR